MCLVLYHSKMASLILQSYSAVQWSTAKVTCLLHDRKWKKQHRCKEATPTPTCLALHTSTSAQTAFCSWWSRILSAIRLSSKGRICSRESLVFRCLYCVFLSASSSRYMASKLAFAVWWPWLISWRRSAVMYTDTSESPDCRCFLLDIYISLCLPVN